jgi:multidrug efflux pump subunit AcrA (membrane-fusion protein)
VTVLLGELRHGIAFWSFYALLRSLRRHQERAATRADSFGEEAKTENWQPEISGIGTLIASEGIDIVPQVGGVVTEVLFESVQA